MLTLSVSCCFSVCLRCRHGNLCRVTSRIIKLYKLKKMERLLLGNSRDLNIQSSFQISYMLAYLLHSIVNLNEFAVERTAEAFEHIPILLIV